MKKISFKIFLFLNCLTYGFIALYILINYLFLEDYQIGLKKKQITALAQEYKPENYEELKEESQQNAIFMKEINFNKDKKNGNFHPMKIIESELWNKVQDGKNILDVQMGRDNIKRIVLAKKIDDEKMLIVTTSIAPITEVIKSTLKFFIYIIFLSIPINLYIAYKFSIRMGKPIESELLELNAQLKSELDKQKKSEIFRKNFISNVTHELKTPVAIIDGYSEAILDGIIEPDEIPDICKNINHEASNMNALIQELLFYCKMESGYIPIKKELINLKETIENILKRYTIDFKLNKINLNTQLDSIEIYSDKKLIDRCLNNIIINALAYVDKNKNINIILNKNEIIIKNSSDNLSNDNLEEYFKPFSKKNDKKIRKYGGTGLGLSVVSEILKNLDFRYNFFYSIDDNSVIFKISL
ncbi:sensor histidine kinase [Candidatus Cetobacterium colombiensis]|uniref:histidine kinase n=1 Tax=Candidatus Cetobacterium colombiensis TaxID=3073100 RepID=A0ABU4W9F9_9FUSO|nr:HAMP domain-containing sensor histidine kinase [Candidatus Cetobacterium colombiensis]MDX8336176.1 HAMP domain-containing sensor histidine kinase [Candidatus Cetobacterium colombiensis]